MTEQYLAAFVYGNVRGVCADCQGQKPSRDLPCISELLLLTIQLIWFYALVSY